MSNTRYCYKTLENYTRWQRCPPLKQDSGYYNISNVRGMCSQDGCSLPPPTKENFCQGCSQMKPAAVRGTWDQVQGLNELNPQAGACVQFHRENYESKPKVLVVSADSWCGFSVKMSKQEGAIKKALKAVGYDCEFINDSKDKKKFDELAKKHKISGFPTTIVGDKTISGYMTPEKLVEKVKNA